MHKNQFGLRGAVLAAVLAAASFTARAETPSKPFFTFDGVNAGETANSALGTWVSKFWFANPDRVDDVDAGGSYTGNFHWVDATLTYGDILVNSYDPAKALSGDNVIGNGSNPMLLSFASPVNIIRFSIAQDLSGFGNPTSNGSYLAFLDATGHEIAGASAYYTQYGNLGLTIQNLATVNNVSGVLLAGGRNYDNMYVNAVAAVPEPETWVMLSGGLLLMGAVARRRRG